MNRFGPVLIRPGRFGLILDMGRFGRKMVKVSRLGPEWLRLWTSLVQFQYALNVLLNLLSRLIKLSCKITENPILLPIDVKTDDLGT